MATETEAVEAAQAELVQLEADHEAWSTEHDTATASLTSLAEGRGQRLLDGDATADELDAEEARLRSRIASAEAATAELDRRAAEARRTVIAAYVAELEERATPYQHAYDEHRAKVDGLLAQLEALDGVPYVVMPAPQQAARKVGRPVGGSLPDVLTASVTSRLAMPLDDLRGRIAKLREWTSRPLASDEFAHALALAEKAASADVAISRTVASAA